MVDEMMEKLFITIEKMILQIMVLQFLFQCVPFATFSLVGHM
jgi:hypothetical protein